MEYLIGLLVLALGGLLWNKQRADNAEALNQNIDTKNKVIDINRDISKDQGLLDAEKAKRDQADADLKAKEKANVTQEDLLKFLNDKPSDDNK